MTFYSAFLKLIFLLLILIFISPLVLSVNMNLVEVPPQMWPCHISLATYLAGERPLILVPFHVPVPLTLAHPLHGTQFALVRSLICVNLLQVQLQVG